jgi:hypothetical protein
MYVPLPSFNPSLGTFQSVTLSGFVSVGFEVVLMTDTSGASWDGGEILDLNFFGVMPIELAAHLYSGILENPNHWGCGRGGSCNVRAGSTGEASLIDPADLSAFISTNTTASLNVGRRTHFVPSNVIGACCSFLYDSPGSFTLNLTYDFIRIPEPSSLMLFGGILAVMASALCIARYRKARSKSRQLSRV